MILLWGIPGDEPLDDVWTALSRLGAEARLLDQRDIREAALGVVGKRAKVTGTVTTVGGELDLTEVRAAYIRPQESSDRGRRADASLIAWADLTDAGVVNRPRLMAANNSKPYQLALISCLGFDVPDTLVTTDPDEVRRFLSDHGQIVYKSVSGARSIVSQLRKEQLARLTDVANAPTQFQQYIAGEDVRAHVVGERVLATLVRSDADDYRYPSDACAHLELAETTLPVEVAECCRAVARGMGLHVAGIDLRLTSDRRWVCFEVNPSPAFTFYERATGQPIAAAVAQLLLRLDETRAGHSRRH